MKAFLFGLVVGFAFKMLFDFILNRAPLGWEDETGFHKLPNEAALRRRNLRKVVKEMNQTSDRK